MIQSTIILVSAGERVVSKSAEEFSRLDPTGITMVIIAMSVVFTVLISLYLTFKYIAKLYKLDIRKYFRRSSPGKEQPAQHEKVEGETLAAISLALHLYHKEVLQKEDMVITIKNAAKNYSPWNSKIYGLRNNPNQKN